MYKSKYIDITQYSSMSYGLNDGLNDDLNEQLKNHIISNIIGDCNKLNYGEGLKIYFMGTDKNNTTLPYVLFIIFNIYSSLYYSSYIDQYYGFIPQHLNFKLISSIFNYFFIC